MTTKEFKELIDGCSFDVKDDECYIGIAKVGIEASLSIEGKPELLEKTLVKLMHKFPDFGDLICNAAEAYDMDLY